MGGHENTDVPVCSRNISRENDVYIKDKISKEPPKLIYLPSFHVANIQNIIPKKVRGNNELFVKDIEKINFLKEQCKDEKPYFMAFAETHLKEEIKEAEFAIEGYSHVTSHRKKQNWWGGNYLYQ